jgi:Tol biopolymer transport system component
VRGNNRESRWSPDGKQIAFVSDRGTHALIAVYEFGRTTLRYADPGVYRDDLPRWSLDGTTLASCARPPVNRLGPSRPGRRPTARPAKSGTAATMPTAAFQFAAGGRIIFASQQDGWPPFKSASA